MAAPRHHVFVGDSDGGDGESQEEKETIFQGAPANAQGPRFVKITLCSLVDTWDRSLACETLGETT